MAVEVPADVLKGIVVIRESGAVNMFSVNEVAQLCRKFGYRKSSKWILEDSERYGRLILEGPAGDENIT